MRVGLDMQLASGTATGIGEYARGLFGALARAPGDGSVVPLSAPWLDPWRFDRRAIWDQVGLPLAALGARVDLIHCLAGTMPLVAHVPLVATVHDVAWLRVQSHTRAYARAYFGAYALRRYRAARALFVDSEFSRTELLTVAPHLATSEIAVAYPGVAADIVTTVRARDDDSPFVLAVGTVEVRKNLEVVVRALAAVPGVRLISVGPSTPYAARVRAIARDVGVDDRVELRGYVPREELLGLYVRALVAVAPSVYEGFGYAAAQALCAGVPLIAAASSSLPEVVGSAAPLVAPDDVDGWIEALRAQVAGRDGAERRATAVRPGAVARFDWNATARLVAAAYDCAAV